MKMIRTMIIAFCLTAPAAQAGEPLLTIGLNPTVLEKGLYAAIGGTTALGGVILSVLGIKRAITEKNEVSSGALLTFAGLALLLAGIHTATGK